MLLLSFWVDICRYSPLRPSLRPSLLLIQQQAEEKVLKKLLKKLKEEEKPACDVTAKKELEKVSARVCPPSLLAINPLCSRHVCFS